MRRSGTRAIRRTYLSNLCSISTTPSPINALSHESPSKHSNLHSASAPIRPGLRRRAAPLAPVLITSSFDDARRIFELLQLSTIEVPLTLPRRENPGWSFEQTFCTSIYVPCHRFDSHTPRVQGYRNEPVTVAANPEAPNPFIPTRNLQFSHCISIVNYREPFRYISKRSFLIVPSPPLRATG